MLGLDVSTVGRGGDDSDYFALLSRDVPVCRPEPIVKLCVIMRSACFTKDGQLKI